MTTGEDEEFTALVHRQSRFVFRVAYAVLLNSHDAEDAVQEAFLKLYRNRGWQHLDNERAFLARVVWRIAVDRRPRAPHPRTSELISHSFDSCTEFSQSVDSPSPYPGPDQTMLVANQHAMVHSMIDTLPEELRLPLVLSAFDELTSREIGGILGIPDGTVRTRLQRARQLLKQKFTTISLPAVRIEETPYA